MAFNVSEFRSTIDRKGLAVNNLFLTRIYFNAGQLGEILGGESAFPAREIPFYCRSVQLPNLDIATTDIKRQGYGVATKTATGMQYNEVPMVFMVDAEFGIKKLFHRWNQAIFNHGNGGSSQMMVDGRKQYELSFHDDITATIEVLVYSYHQQQVVYTYKFEGCFPTAIANPQIGWENSAEIMTMSVNFAYDSFSVDGAENGSVTGLAQSGNGILGFLSSINSVVQSVKQLRLPRNIQDAVVQTNNLGTIINNLPGFR